MLRDFHCAACNEDFEDYVSSGLDRQAACPKCGTVCEMVMSAPHVGAFSLKSPEQKAQALRKRSHDHTIRELKKEPEKHGFAADDTRRWNIRGHAKSST